MKAVADTRFLRLLTIHSHECAEAPGFRQGRGLGYLLLLRKIEALNFSYKNVKPSPRRFYLIKVLADAPFHWASEDLQSSKPSARPFLLVFAM